MQTSILSLPEQTPEQMPVQAKLSSCRFMGYLKFQKNKQRTIKPWFKPEESEMYENYKIQKLQEQIAFFSPVKYLDWRAGCGFMRQFCMNKRRFHSADALNTTIYCSEIFELTLHPWTHKHYGYAYLHLHALKALINFPHAQFVALRAYRHRTYAQSTEMFLIKKNYRDFVVFGAELDTLKNLVTEVCNNLRQKKIKQMHTQAEIKNREQKKQSSGTLVSRLFRSPSST